MIGREIADILQEINPIILQAMNSPHEVAIKSDGSIVTSIDLQVEQILLPQLKKLLPEASVISEESAPIEPKAVASLFQSDYLWAVDPIDGTLNFATGIPIFAVSIGLLKREHHGYSAISGAVSLPTFSEIYYTQKDRTIFRNISLAKETEVERLDNLSTPIVLIPSSFHRNYRINKNSKLVKNIRQIGCTAANLLYVGLGKASATFTSSHLWDFAASLTIAKTFGIFPRVLSTGSVKQYFTSEDFIFGTPKQNWRIKEPFALCEEKYFADMKKLLQG